MNLQVFVKKNMISTRTVCCLDLATIVLSVQYLDHALDVLASAYGYALVWEYLRLCIEGAFLYPHVNILTARVTLLLTRLSSYLWLVLYKDSLSHLLHWLLWLLVCSTRLVAGNQINSFFAQGNRLNYLCEMYLAIDSIQKYSLLSTLSSLCEGWLNFSITHCFLKACFIHAALRMISYSSTDTPNN